MESAKTSKRIFNIVFRLIICAGLIFAGIIGMQTLAKMKKPPAEVKQEEKPLRVEVMQAKTEDVPVTITGYGEVKALDVVSIAPEVSGKIVSIHPRLELGEIIPKGEVLFKIDARNYQASLSEARASVQQWKNAILRLEKQYAIDQERLKTLQRNRELAKAEFERIRRLFEKDSVGTRSGVDAGERAYNSASDQADQMGQAVELYPIQIREAENSLTAARARQKLAQANLERCRVRSPFDGRVKAVSLEAGQYVSPGISVLTLADDSVLEIRVPLDSRDARKWLRFDGEGAEDMAWFSSLSSVPCQIRWTEDQSGHHWEGRLHRVVEFEQQTRTLTVAVRVDAKNARSPDGNRLPLVDGMFCSVDIPGQPLRSVIRLPRWAVSFENTVYLASEDRLKTVPVEVARIQGEETFVSAGISPGDVVITTRLADPLENALLKITNSVE